MCRLSEFTTESQRMEDEQLALLKFRTTGMQESPAQLLMSQRLLSTLVTLPKQPSISQYRYA